MRANTYLFTAMSRSIWKAPVIHRHADKPTYIRSAMIGPGSIGQTIQVHNGNRFIRIRITEQCVGYKCGAFARTKKRVFHKRKKKK